MNPDVLLAVAFLLFAVGFLIEHASLLRLQRRVEALESRWRLPKATTVTFIGVEDSHEPE